MLSTSRCRIGIDRATDFLAMLGSSASIQFAMIALPIDIKAYTVKNFNPWRCCGPILPFDASGINQLLTKTAHS